MVTGKPEQLKVTTIPLTEQIAAVIRRIDEYFHLGAKLNKDDRPIQLGYSTFYKLKSCKQKNVEVGSVEKIVLYVKDHIQDLSQDQQIILVDKLKALTSIIPTLKSWIKNLQLPKVVKEEKVEEPVLSINIASPSTPVVTEAIEIVEKKKKPEVEETKRSTIPSNEQPLDLENLSSDELLKVIEIFKRKRLQELFQQRVQNGVALYLKWKGLATAGEQVPFERIVLNGDAPGGYISLEEGEHFLFKEDYMYLQSLSKELGKKVLLLKKNICHVEVYISA